MSKYPRIKGYRRKPNKERDGSKNYGLPCIVCGVGTVGEKWVQYSYMRGDDETARLCADDWETSDDLVLNHLLDYPVDQHQ